MAFSTHLSPNNPGPYLPSLKGFFLVSMAKPGTTAVLFSPEFQASVPYNCSVRWMCEKIKTHTQGCPSCFSDARGP